jgi:hypothetical protein
VGPDKKDGGADGVEEGKGDEDVANAGNNGEDDPYVDQGNHRLNHSLPERVVEFNISWPSATEESQPKATEIFVNS